MDGWNTTFILGRPIFRGYVSFREGIGKFAQFFLHQHFKSQSLTWRCTSQSHAEFWACWLCMVRRSWLGPGHLVRQTCDDNPRTSRKKWRSHNHGNEKTKRKLFRNFQIFVAYLKNPWENEKNIRFPLFPVVPRFFVAQHNARIPMVVFAFFLGVFP